jgi:septal ring factor EnvC (AmiA/AmiB activator)
VLFGWRYTAKQREIGALQVTLADDVRVLAKATKRSDSLETAFRVDTLKLFKRITNTVTQLDTLVRSDTLKLTDTVKVTVEVVREAQETILACRATVVTCGELNESRRQQIDALEAETRKLKALKPSLLSRCGLSAGYGATDKGFGPAVLVGCRIAP